MIEEISPDKVCNSAWFISTFFHQIGDFDWCFDLFIAIVNIVTPNPLYMLENSYLKYDLFKL